MFYNIFFINIALMKGVHYRCRLICLSYILLRRIHICYIFIVQEMIIEYIDNNNNNNALIQFFTY